MGRDAAEAYLNYARAELDYTLGQFCSKRETLRLNRRSGRQQRKAIKYNHLVANSRGKTGLGPISSVPPQSRAGEPLTRLRKMVLDSVPWGTAPGKGNLRSKVPIASIKADVRTTYIRL